MTWDDFRPGDVVEESSGYSRVVRCVERHRELKRTGCRCGHCEEDYEDVLYLFVDAEETSEVILAGGGTARVVLAERYPGHLPSPGFRVFRNGRLVHGPDPVEVAKGGSSEPWERPRSWSASSRGLPTGSRCPTMNPRHRR